MLIAAKREDGYLPGKYDKQSCSQDAEDNGGSPKHRGGLSDPLCLARTNCLGYLANATTVDAHTRNALGKIGD